MDAVSGTQSTQTVWLQGKTLKKGDTITLTYTKDSSQSVPSETSTFVEIKCDPIYTYTQTGTETKELAKLAKRAYKGTKSGRAMLWYDASTSAAIEYTGDMAVTENIVVDNITYNMYTLTSSGTLKVSSDAKYWACGGGAGGADGSNTSGSPAYYFGGLGGSGGFVGSGNLTGGETYTISIGSGGVSATASMSTGGQTKIGTTVIKGGTNGNSGSSSPHGGSGGGGAAFVYGSSSAYYQGGGVSPGGTGAGVSTYPFGLTSLKAHSAGGGGGGAAYRWTQDSSVSNPYGRKDGAVGGSNGGNGASGSSTYGNSSNAGGDYGGGNGSNFDEAGTNATFYGGGGGGGASNFGTNSKGGSGYQGVVYILIKK